MLMSVARQTTVRWRLASIAASDFCRVAVTAIQSECASVLLVIEFRACFFY